MTSNPSRVRKVNKLIESRGYHETIFYIYLVRSMSYFPLKLVNFGFLCLGIIIAGVKFVFWLSKGKKLEVV